MWSQWSRCPMSFYFFWLKREPCPEHTNQYTPQDWAQQHGLLGPDVGGNGGNSLTDCEGRGPFFLWPCVLQRDSQDIVGLGSLKKGKGSWYLCWRQRRKRLTEPQVGGFFQNFRRARGLWLYIIKWLMMVVSQGFFFVSNNMNLWLNFPFLVSLKNVIEECFTDFLNWIWKYIVYFRYPKNIQIYFFIWNKIWLWILYKF